MLIPEPLRATTTESIQTSIGAINVPKAQPRFNRWDGPAVADTYGNKPILKYDSRPVFAELLIVRLLNVYGWDGVWVDNYRKAYRTEYWPRNSLVLPPDQQEFRH